MKKRGQVSMELLLTVGFALIMIIPITLLFYDHATRTNQEIENNQGLVIARKIADTANEVYYLGYPSSVTLKMYIPNNLESIRILQNEITLKSVEGIEAVAVADVNLTGNISTSSGVRYLKIEAFANYVNISDVD